jgi:hypothetical protein
MQLFLFSRSVAWGGEGGQNEKSLFLSNEFLVNLMVFNQFLAMDLIAARYLD